MRCCPRGVMRRDVDGPKRPLKYGRRRNGPFFGCELGDWIYVRRRLWTGEGGVVEPLNVVVIIADSGPRPERMVRVGLEMPVNDVRMVIVVRAREMDVLRRQER